MPARRIEDILATLRSDVVQVRESGLSRLEDLLERGLGDEDLTVVVERLFAMVRVERDATILEALLYDLHLTFRGPANGPAPALDSSLNPIVKLLERPTLPVELLCYCLDILALSHRQVYRPVLERFATHPDPSVRETVVSALTELGGAH